MISVSFFRRTAGLVLSTVLLSLTHAGALDLTPEPGFVRGNEGPPTPVVRFTNGKKKVTYPPATGWRCVGGTSKAVVFAAGSATMEMRLVARRPPKDDDPPEDLAAWAQQFVPGGGKNVALLQTLPSPFQVGGRTSTEFLFGFVRQAGPEKISISVVDYTPEERFVVIISADGKEFNGRLGEAISSLHRWSEE